MSLITKLPNGKVQINSKEAFCELLSGNLPKTTDSFSKLIDQFDKQIRKKYPKVTGSALNNVHGVWYEWFIAICAWNYHVANPKSFLTLLLPNIITFDVIRLYVDELFELIVDLRDKIDKATSVKLITSNPDFVLINPKGLTIPNKFGGKITTLNVTILDQLEKAYTNFISKCNFENIAGYISAKRSLRPDRRLQIPHEGSLMKAIYTHMQTRQWIIQPEGLKYYAFTASATSADKNALKTVATHSITTVHSIPQAAVDEVFEVDSFNVCHSTFANILR